MKNIIFALAVTASLSVPVAVLAADSPAPPAAAENPSIAPRQANPVITQALVSDVKIIRPFGSNLFSTQVTSGTKEPNNPNYQIVPGDQVDIEVWGAANYRHTSVVDAQGNIFLPDVGPVKVQGVTQAQLNEVVKQKVGAVYKDNVQIYTNLMGRQPVSVFVTGAVPAPGRYVGTSTDSIIDYIYKAGGIDDERGSYREIKLVRDNLPLQDIDIYQFLINGVLPKMQIREGDTLLVTERGKVVTVDGLVKHPFRFEFKTDEILGSDVATFSSPLVNATHALVEGTRESKPFKQYLTIAGLKTTRLEDGDKVIFSAGTHYEEIAVSISGRHLGPKEMVVPLNAKLVEVLNNVPIDRELANTDAVYLRRKSVAEKQKQAIEESIRRLEETLILARASGVAPAEAQPISSAEVTLVQAFVEKAKFIKPEGRVVVVSRSRGISNITLEEGDEIVIPQKTDLVMVNGEVLMPKAIVWEKGLDADDYIKKAGGFTDRANESKLVIIRPNGETDIGHNVEIYPGDEIMVLPEVKINNLDLAAKVVDVIYKVAVAAVIPFRL